MAGGAGDERVTVAEPIALAVVPQDLVSN